MCHDLVLAQRDHRARPGKRSGLGLVLQPSVCVRIRGFGHQTCNHAAEPGSQAREPGCQGSLPSLAASERTSLPTVAGRPEAANGLGSDASFPGRQTARRPVRTHSFAAAAAAAMLRRSGSGSFRGSSAPRDRAIERLTERESGPSAVGKCFVETRPRRISAPYLLHIIRNRGLAAWQHQTAAIAPMPKWRCMVRAKAECVCRDNTVQALFVAMHDAVAAVHVPGRDSRLCSA